MRGIVLPVQEQPGAAEGKHAHTNEQVAEQGIVAELPTDEEVEQMIDEYRMKKYGGGITS